MGFPPRALRNTVIGRGGSNTIRLAASPHVSAKSTQSSRRGTKIGSSRIYRSSNGTYVNRAPVVGEHLLDGGDVVQIGGYRLELLSEDIGLVAVPGASLQNALPALPLVFCSYAKEDESLFQEFRAHIRPLVRDYRVRTCYEAKIIAGAEYSIVLQEQLENANIIVLLISASYFSSDSCYLQMGRAALNAARWGGCRPHHRPGVRLATYAIASGGVQALSSRPRS